MLLKKLYGYLSIIQRKTEKTAPVTNGPEQKPSKTNELWKLTENDEISTG